MNYEDLVIASKAYADRYDVEVDTTMDVFITMVESRVNRLLKTRKQTTRGALVAGGGLEFYTLPEDWLGMRDINLVTATYYPDTGEETFAQCSYHLLDPKTFTERRAGVATDVNYYVIINNQLNIFPILDNTDPNVTQTIEMVYFQKCPHLAANSIANPDSDSNWLSESQPDIYLSGICAEISLFAKDYDAAQTWYDRLKLAIDELDNVDWVERWSGDPLQIRLG